MDDHTPPVRVRIAPSPTGHCHVGTARGALYNLLFARQRQGTFILRIDDTDRQRSTQRSEARVLAGLSWLGLNWDEGPDVGGPYGPYRQSERLSLYHAYLQTLLDNGRAYYCFCTPDELAAERKAARARGEPPRYSGRCRRLPAATVRARRADGHKAVVRLRIDPKLMSFMDLVQGCVEQDAALLSDPVIMKSDGMPTYHFATVVDEVTMRISHVLRGVEHLNNTFPQLQIYEALGYDPPQFAHLGLLLNPDRSKISKRAGAVYVGDFQTMGYLPEAMINHLALSGWSPGTDQEIFSFDELLDAFSLERCSPANAIYDRDKLLWLNGIHVRQLSTAELTRRVVPFLLEADLLSSDTASSTTLSDAMEQRLERLVALVQERIKTLDEVPDLLAFFFRDPNPDDCLHLLKTHRFTKRLTLRQLGSGLSAARQTLAGVDHAHWGSETLAETLDRQVEVLGWKRGEFLMTIRMAVSGQPATPSLFETLAHVGRAATLRRLGAVVSRMHATEEIRG